MIIAAYIVGGVIVFFGMMAFLVKVILSRARRTLEEKYPQHCRILTCPMANFFGVRSRGYRQVRGNGILILTDSELFFRMLLPAKELRIPLRSVTSVETVRSFLGKSKLRTLVKVNFRNSQGADDAAAWLVKDTDQWIDGVRDRLN
ncbi:MAG: hypothetical protein GF388_08040 [Candidatus Aegiribacteria sp.]|nr:hypothetical protein [Candidatus Aegiribacteria sp.]MBD3295043.1 hypothetical protein [Candidatus Fermentibacteria bacterium]